MLQFLARKVFDFDTYIPIHLDVWNGGESLNSKVLSKVGPSIQL